MIYLEGRVAQYIGDVHGVLAAMEPDSVDCVVCSPPYWGLRSYIDDDSPDKVFEIGLEPTLGEHLAVMVRVFEAVRRVLKPTGTLWVNYGDCYATSPNGRSAADTKATGNDDRTFRDKPFSTIGGVLKAKDLAMVPNRLAIALQEPRYTGHILSEVDRVWLAAIIDGEGSIYIHRQPKGSKTGRNGTRTQDNFCIGIAISNCSEAIVRKAASICGKENIQHIAAKGGNRRDHYHWRVTGNVAKSILLEVYPYLVAKQREARIAIACPPSGDVAAATWVALMDLHKGRATDFDADAPDPKVLWQPGWWVRSEIIWAKPNPMPESIRDRPATSHEKIFLLSKSAKYWYDDAAVRQPVSGNTHARVSQDVANQIGSARANGGRKTNGNMKAVTRKQDKTAAAAGAVGASSGRRMAGFNERWDAKEAGRKIVPEGDLCRNKQSYYDATALPVSDRNLRNYEPAPVAVWNIATQPFSDAHFATFPPELAERCILAGCPKGGLVLDPFGGAGTTALVALRHHRRAALVELNPAYAEMARTRIETEWRVPAKPKSVDHGPLFAGEAS
jgi:DNA modification methylase